MMDAYTTEYGGPCMNHRTSTANLDVILRMRLVPHDGGDILSLPGLVCHNRCKLQIRFLKRKAFRFLCGASTLGRKKIGEVWSTFGTMPWLERYGKYFRRHASLAIEILSRNDRVFAESRLGRQRVKIFSSKSTDLL